MPNLKQTLEKFGLSPNESACYLAALELGSASVQKIAKKSEVKRTTVYTVLEELIKKGLIAKSEAKGKTVYVAEDPNYLIRREEERKRELVDAIPELKSIYNLSESKPSVKFYEGVEGLKTIYDDTLKEGRDIVAFSDFEHMIKTMSLDWMVDYADRRAKNGIKFRGITRASAGLDQISPYDTRQKRELKILPQGNFSTEINIYGNKVAMMSFRNPMGVIIEDKAIAATLRIVFENLWRSLPENNM